MNVKHYRVCPLVTFELTDLINGFFKISYPIIELQHVASNRNLVSSFVIILFNSYIEYAAGLSIPTISLVVSRYISKILTTMLMRGNGII